MPRTFERLAITVRHSHVLERADPLWDAVRPAYDALLARLFRRKGLMRTINGEIFQVDSRCRNLREEHEPAVWRGFVDAARPGDHAVDVGAHLGIYSIALARRVHPAGRVTSFEPDDQNAHLLRRHLDLNGVRGRISERPVALGRHTGKALFVAGESQISRIDAAGGREVELSTLDAEFPDIRVDLLKVDVEGYELEVLAGGRALLRDPTRRPRLIALEVHPDRLAALGQSPVDVRALLTEYGYTVQELADDPLTKAWMARPRGPDG